MMRCGGMGMSFDGKKHMNFHRMEKGKRETEKDERSHERSERKKVGVSEMVTEYLNFFNFHSYLDRTPLQSALPQHR